MMRKRGKTATATPAAWAARLQMLGAIGKGPMGLFVGGLGGSGQSV